MHNLGPTQISNLFSHLKLQPNSVLELTVVEMLSIYVTQYGGLSLMNP